METNKINIIKLGGEVIEDANKLLSFLKMFVEYPGHKILVHGGGKTASSVARKLGLNVTMIDGRRVTDLKMREVVQSVYGGLVNKNLVSNLQGLGCPAIGLTGADMGVIKAHRRGLLNGIDYGYVGEVDEVDSDQLLGLLKMGLTPVIAPLSWDPNFGLLNTNADTITREIATSITSKLGLPTEVYFSFGLDGVLKDINNPDTLISTLDKNTYHADKKSGSITAGMIAKLDNAFACIDNGVTQVTIGSWANINSPEKGTRLILEQGASYD